jgi:hypothetical protein
MEPNVRCHVPHNRLVLQPVPGWKHLEIELFPRKRLGNGPETFKEMFPEVFSTFLAVRISELFPPREEGEVFPAT